MENILHYVWKHKLYSPVDLITNKGDTVVVIDTGMQNTDAGPDFFNAKVKIGNTIWVGSVEIHTKASDWIRHNHHKDKMYDSVVLHLVTDDDKAVYRSNGELIPQLVLIVPDQIIRNIEWLTQRETPLHCLYYIKNIEPVFLTSWINVLLSERLERKTDDIYRLLEHSNNDWNEVFYITLTRNFGFGINNDAFERLAKSLPFRYIQKQRISSSQVEALLFGQAGMFDEKEDCHYYRLLQQEYKFLKHKFSLNPIDESLFKSMRTRPVNFPHLKLAQLAAIWYKYDTLFSIILEEENPENIKNLFRIQPSDYWETHYHFRYSSPPKIKLLGENSLNIILINTVIPLLFAYGKKNKLAEYTDKALKLLESIPPEKNNIVSLFCQAGIKVYHAGDSQAIIQLKREYCEKKKCLYCRIGFNLLKRITP